MGEVGVGSENTLLFDTSQASGPMILRAMAVCSGGQYGWGALRAFGSEFEHLGSSAARTRHFLGGRHGHVERGVHVEVRIVVRGFSSQACGDR